MEKNIKNSSTNKKEEAATAEWMKDEKVRERPGIMSFFSLIFKYLLLGILLIVQYIFQAISFIFNMLLHGAMWIVNILTPWLKYSFNFIFQSLGAALQWIYDNGPAIITKTLKAILSFVSKAWRAFYQNISKLWQSIYARLSNIWKTITDYFKGNNDDNEPENDQNNDNDEQGPDDDDNDDYNDGDEPVKESFSLTYFILEYTVLPFLTFIQLLIEDPVSIWRTLSYPFRDFQGFLNISEEFTVSLVRKIFQFIGQLFFFAVIFMYFSVAFAKLNHLDSELTKINEPVVEQPPVFDFFSYQKEEYGFTEWVNDDFNDLQIKSYDFNNVIVTKIVAIVTKIVQQILKPNQITMKNEEEFTPPNYDDHFQEQINAFNTMTNLEGLIVFLGTIFGIQLSK